MQRKIAILMLTCLFPIPAWPWDIGNIGDKALIRDSRDLSRLQVEVRSRENDILRRLTERIDVLEKQVAKQNEVIATYEKLVVSLKAELEKENSNGSGNK